MTLEKLLITLGDKKISLKINENGIRIKPLIEELTLNELQYMSAVSFVYLWSKIHKKDYEADEVLLRGYKVYTEYNAMMKKKGLDGPDVKELT